MQPQTLRYDFVGEMRSLAADVQALGALLEPRCCCRKERVRLAGNRNASRQPTRATARSARGSFFADAARRSRAALPYERRVRGERY